MPHTRHRPLRSLRSPTAATVAAAALALALQAACRLSRPPSCTLPQQCRPGIRASVTVSEAASTSTLSSACGRQLNT